MKRLLFLFLLLVCVVIPTVWAWGKDAPVAVFSDYVDETGVISLPENYRSDWVHLGSWAVKDPKAPGHGFHDVYTQSNSLAAYKKNGQFPDGAVLVKEIRKIESGKLTTGQASWAGDVSVWFVMIKDQHNRFEDNPNWGEGWGWALFKSEDPKKNASSNYAADCLGCHVPAEGNDWVFVEGYPTLK